MYIQFDNELYDNQPFIFPEKTLQRQFLKMKGFRQNADVTGIAGIRSVAQCSIFWTYIFENAQWQVILSNIYLEIYVSRLITMVITQLSNSFESLLQK